MVGASAVVTVDSGFSLGLLAFDEHAGQVAISENKIAKIPSGRLKMCLASRLGISFCSRQSIIYVQSTSVARVRLRDTVCQLCQNIAA